MQALFGRKRKEPSTTPISYEEPPTMPVNFAQEVLDLEGEIDIQCNLTNVKRLMELYSLAIECYGAQQGHRYLHYRSRLHNLLAREDVQYLLENPTVPEMSRIEELKMKKRVKIPRKAIDNNALAINRTTEKTLQNHKIESSTSSKMLQSNLKSQCESLCIRLIQRKEKNKEKHDSVESDKSGGVRCSSKTKLEHFELEIEIVMEKYIEEKYSVKSEIESKFDEQIREIKEIGSGALFNHVVEKMRMTMRNEIEEKHRILKTRKNEEITRIRSSYL